MENTSNEKNVLTRRGLIACGAGALGVLAGGALGYKEHDRVVEWRAERKSASPEPTIHGSPTFGRHAADVRAAQERQTAHLVKQLKAKYESPVFGKVRVWDMIQKLSLCVDPTDDALLLTSQYVHVLQILESMERDGVHDRNMILTALLHDLGKVMLLTTEAPENIVCFTHPIGKYPKGIGLDNLVVQFGHDEMVYSRLKDYVPEPVAWTIRYHSTLPDTVDQFVSEKERIDKFPLLEKFRVYDQGTKSHRHFPKVDLAKYRVLVEDCFPGTILF